MNLYLVQHAESKPKQEDPERGLTDKGLNDIRKVAAYLTEHTDIQVRSILHSGKTRARQTAEALAERLNPPDGITETDGLAPLDDPSIWANRVYPASRGLTETDEDTFLVGHLPHLSKLASLLLSGDQDKTIISFQMAGITCLTKDEAGDWSVRWIVVPEMLA